MRSVRLGHREITDTTRPVLIAEIGNNHQGDPDLALELIDAAAASGADIVKFQRRTNAALYTAAYRNRPYLGPQSFGETYGAHRDALELPDDAWPRLARRAHDRGVLVCATPFDLPACAFLARLELPCLKIASASIRHHLLIREALTSTDGPLIVSVGGATRSDVADLVEIVPRDRLILLHATCAYPTPDEACFLAEIQALRVRYPELVIGFSNHNPRGPLVPAAAYAMGARVIECHFTLDRSSRGTDHAMSLEPNGLRKLRGYLDRLWRVCRPKPVFTLPSEVDGLAKMGCIAYAARPLPAGTVLGHADVAFKSPALPGGVASRDLDQVIGATTTQEMQTDDPFLESTYTHSAVHPDHAGARVGNGDHRRGDA